MNIGTKIKVLRAKKGLSQQQLADLINKTRTLISNIEVTSKVNFYTLNEIAKALDVSVSFFTEENADKFLEESTQEYNTIAEQVEKLSRENELLNEVIANQKDLIKQLKDQLKK